MGFTGASDVRPLGLPLHVGIHAGDVIREEGNVYGGAVNVAARVAEEARAGETLVSGTVRDLARTSAGVSFEDRGRYGKTSDGASIAYATAGRGQDIVLMPPLPVSHVELRVRVLPETWQDLFRSFRVTWYDARGGGLSERHALAFSLEAYGKRRGMRPSFVVTSPRKWRSSRSSPGRIS